MTAISLVAMRADRTRPPAVPTYGVNQIARRLLFLVLLMAGAPQLAGCSDNKAEAVPARAFGDAKTGRALINQFGCGSCHVIPGIRGADATVGPPLTQMGRRIYVAGMLRNTPDNLATWIEHPQRIVPGNAMPEMGVSRQQAQDIATYLLTLK